MPRSVFRSIPDTATLAETGFSREHTRAYFGLLAPPGTPRAITERIRKEIVEIASDPTFVKRHFTDRGLEPILNTPEQFRDFLAADREKSRRIVERAGLGVK